MRHVELLRPHALLAPAAGGETDEVARGGVGHPDRAVHDFLLHVAVRDTQALYAFVIDRLTERDEVADVETSVVYEHIRRPVLEPLE